ncbi:hypothetical protein SNL152K_7203 [Streptomyces sp. NL15-2K]|nr:hypothetical protein SNL152K_7203 [Streptomyces sp. NL15-2K]
MKRQIILRGGLPAAAAITLTICLAGMGTAAEAQSATSSSSTGTVSVQAAGKVTWNPNAKPKHVKSIPGKCGKTPIAEASGRGPITLRIDETKSMSTTYSKSFSVNYKALTAAVGWDITKSRSITVSGAKEVPRGKYGVLKAYTRYSGKQFDVYNPVEFKWTAKGVKAYKPIGVCYAFSAR